MGAWPLASPITTPIGVTHRVAVAALCDDVLAFRQAPAGVALFDRTTLAA